MVRIVQFANEKRKWELTRWSNQGNDNTADNDDDDDDYDDDDDDNDDNDDDAFDDSVGNGFLNYGILQPI